jgi:outer membrane receptor protein involved in Fe transport
MGVSREFVERNMVWLATLILAAIPVAAQLPTGAILGTVRDSSGASIPNAVVTVRNTDTNLRRTATTEQDGSYRFSELPVGPYEVKVEAAGFKTETRTGLTLEVTQQGVVNFDLQVGAGAEQVTVSSELPLVNTQDSTLGGTINEHQMAELPLNGRNYIDLALYKPGVNKDKQQRNQVEGTSFSVNGAPPRSNNFTLDGAILQNSTGRSPVAGDSGNALGLDGIREFRIVTGTFQAEYGLAMGSQMVAVSKAGTNQFHGDVFEYLRNSALDANDFFANKGGVDVAPLQRNQFGAAFGGPVKKDKTFFYGVYEGLRQNLGVTNNNLVPSAGCIQPAGSTVWNGLGSQPAGTTLCPDIGPNPADPNPANPTVPYTVKISPYTAPFLALVPPPNVTVPASEILTGGNLSANIFNDHNTLSENYGQMRVDQNFSTKDTLFARYTVDNAILDNTQGDYRYFRNLGSARNQWITLAENHTFAPTLLNTARFSFSRTNRFTSINNTGLPNGTGPAIVSGFSTGVVDMNSAAGGTYSEFGSVNAAPTTFALQNIYTLSDDVIWTRGKHTFKFGTLLNRYNISNQATNSYNGQIQFNTFVDFLTSNPSVVEFAPPGVNENRYYIFNTYGFYGQDDWRATPRLTLNLGLRYEFMSTPGELQKKQSRLVDDSSGVFTVGPIIQNNTRHDFSPRLGLAYDLFGNGKTAIRGGAGIYYDMGNIGSVLANNTIGAPPYSGLVDILPNTCPATAPDQAPPGCFDWETKLGTGANGFPFPIPPQVLSFYCINNPANPSCPNPPGAASGVTPQFMDYRYLSPYMIQYNASVQQQLPLNMVIGVAYVGNHGVHLATIRESNPILPTSFGSCGDPANLCVGGHVPFWNTNCVGPPLPAGCTSAYANVNPNMGSTINIGTFAASRYNALQIVLQKRTSHGLEFDTAFTHSRVTDDTQGQANIQDCIVSGGLLGTYPLDQSVDKGPACFNIPNNWEFNALYHFPNRMAGDGFIAKALNGWFISSIVTVESGEPFSPIVGNNRSQSGVLQGQNDRVNVNTPALLAAYPCNPGTNPCAYTPVPYDPNSVITGRVDQWFNPNMFSISPECLGPGLTNCSTAVGQLGTAGRNILSGPPFRNWDFSLAKETKLGFLGEAGTVHFRAEFFNVLNHPNFKAPGAQVFAGRYGDLTPFSEVPSSGGGQLTQMEGKPRQIQFALRLEF